MVALTRVGIGLCDKSALKKHSTLANQLPPAFPMSKRVQTSDQEGRHRALVNLEMASSALAQAKEMADESKDARIAPDDDAMQSQQWPGPLIESLNLSAAAAKMLTDYLHEEGFDDRETTKTLTFEDLKETGFKTGTARKILKAVAEL